MWSLLACVGVLIHSQKAFVTKIPFPVSIMLYRGGALHFDNTVHAATRFYECSCHYRGYPVSGIPFVRVQTGMTLRLALVFNNVPGGCPHRPEKTFLLPAFVHVLGPVITEYERFCLFNTFGTCIHPLYVRKTYKF